jgi:hypothetical protein
MFNSANDTRFEVKIMKRVFLTLLLAVFAPLSTAGSAAAGTLSLLHFMSNGVVIVYTNGARSGVPSCSPFPTRFALNASTAAGKTQLAGLLTAYASGSPVVIMGTGTCSVWSDTESIDYFYTA